MADLAKQHQDDGADVTKNMGLALAAYAVGLALGPVLGGYLATKNPRCVSRPRGVLAPPAPLALTTCVGVRRYAFALAGVVMLCTALFVTRFVKESNPYAQQTPLRLADWRKGVKFMVRAVAQYCVLMSILWRNLHLGLLSLLLILSTLTYGVYLQV
jgi:MFS family permease